MSFSINDVKIRNELLSQSLKHNSFIGFDKEEILNSDTDDLFMIRKIVSDYLNSTKLKKRNANFLQVFHRINKELFRRGKISLRKRDKKKISVFTHRKTENSTRSTHSSSSSNACDPALELCNKTANKINVEIPNFFNDKKKLIDLDSVEIDDMSHATGIRNNKIKSMRIKNKMTIDKNEKSDKLYYEKNLKPNFSDEDLFFPSHNTEVLEQDLKELELKSVMFDILIEDNLFELDEMLV